MSSISGGVAPPLLARGLAGISLAAPHPSALTAPSQRVPVADDETSAISVNPPSTPRAPDDSRVWTPEARARTLRAGHPSRAKAKAADSPPSYGAGEQLDVGSTRLGGSGAHCRFLSRAGRRPVGAASRGGGGAPLLPQRHHARAPLVDVPRGIVLSDERVAGLPSEARRVADGGSPSCTSRAPPARRRLTDGGVRFRRPAASCSETCCRPSPSRRSSGFKTTCSTRGVGAAWRCLFAPDSSASETTRAARPCSPTACVHGE